jgi:uncharacterized membrane protein YuzA (DUF378 family)
LSGQTFDNEVMEEAVRKLDLLALVLAVVGALNWGLVAIAEFDLVAAIFGLDFGDTNALTRVIYALVGVAGVWLAVRARVLVASPSADRHRVPA